MKKPAPPTSGRTFPDFSEAAQIEAIAPGSGVKLVEAYFRMLDTEDEERRARILTDVADAAHARLYRHLCLLLGTGLASGAIALGAYGIARGADIYSIAALVGPISGLAGVFVWGGRVKTVQRAHDRDDPKP